ncbi:MAG: YidC/Oxa1 family membrane protein insertase [Culicoidibacterales bacterium]
MGNNKKQIIRVLKILFGIFTILLWMQVTATIGKQTIDFSKPLPWTVDNLYANIVLFPMHNVLEFFKTTTGNYGYAIILLTIVVNIIGLPVFGYAEYKRVLAEPLQKKMQEDRERIEKKYEGQTDSESVRKKQMEMSQSMQANGGFFGATGGCFPQLVMMSFSLLFLSSIFFLTRTYEALKGSTFFWIKLGEKDLILMIILLLVAVLSAYFMQPKEGRNWKGQQFTSAVMINVLLYGMFAWMNNAGFAIYSIVHMTITMVRTDTIRSIVAKLRKSGKIKETAGLNTKVKEADVVKITKKY